MYHRGKTTLWCVKKTTIKCYVKFKVSTKSQYSSIKTMSKVNATCVHIISEISQISQQPSPAGVVEVSSDAPLEEALAALAGEHTIVLPAGLVPAHHAVHHAGLVLVPDVHVAAPSLRRDVLFLPPQVSLFPQSISVPVGVGPTPAHHGHIL